MSSRARKWGPRLLPVDLHGRQRLLDGGIRALDELGIEIGDDFEPRVAGPPDIRGAGFHPGVGEAVGVEHAPIREPPDVFPGEGVGGDEVAPAVKAGGGFGEHRGPGIPDRGQEPAVAGEQGVGEDAPAVMPQGRGDDHGGNLPLCGRDHKSLWR